MVMVVVGGGKALGSLENIVMLRKDILKVGMHRGYLNCLNGMELGNDVIMTFLGKLFYAMGTDDIWRPYYNSLEFLFLSFLLEFYG